MPEPQIGEYYVGWICALHKELAAAISMLDCKYSALDEQQEQDRNSYTLGRIHEHNVIIACLPDGDDGLVNAATVTRDMARTFPALRVCLLVGIGGGIPNLDKNIDIRLGDVVVSRPNAPDGGVVQYDKGKAEGDGRFVLKGSLNRPPDLLLQTLSRVRAEHELEDSRMSFYMEEAIKRKPKLRTSGYILPTAQDILYCGKCDQNIEKSNINCSESHKSRSARTRDESPSIHYGIIASANQVVKDSTVRDYLRDIFEAICVEMEAAGLMNHFPCLVIRGICDYADSHKNDVWHPYAAMTAAAYAKEFLQFIPPKQIIHEEPLQKTLGE